MNRAARFMEDWPSDDLRILSGASAPDTEDLSRSGLWGLGLGDVDGDGTLRCAAAAHGIAALKPGRRVLPLPDAAERRWSGLAEPTLLAGRAEDLTAVLDALRASAVTDVHVLVRRDPLHVKFTPAELRGLGGLEFAVEVGAEQFVASVFVHGTWVALLTLSLGRERVTPDQDK